MWQTMIGNFGGMHKNECIKNFSYINRLSLLLILQLLLFLSVYFILFQKLILDGED